MTSRVQRSIGVHATHPARTPPNNTPSPTPSVKRYEHDDPHDSLTFKVSRTVLGNHGLSVLIYDPNNTKDTVQVWMKAQVFSAYSDAKSTRSVVMCYGDHVVIYANDPLGC